MKTKLTLFMLFWVFSFSSTTKGQNTLHQEMWKYSGNENPIESFPRQHKPLYDVRRSNVINGDTISLLDSTRSFYYYSNDDSVSYHKTLYRYNESQVLEEETWYRRKDNHPDSGWYADEYYYYFYDSSQKLTKKLNVRWIEYYQEYRIMNETRYYYDVQNRPEKTEVYYRDNENNKWKLHDKYINGYDENGRIILTEIWQINTQTQKCEPTWQYHYHFNDFNKVDTFLIKVWVKYPLEWRQNEMVTYFFNDHQKDTLQVYQRWYNSQQKWKATKKTNSEYNEKGWLTKQIDYEKKPDSVIWNPQKRYDKFYDDGGVLQQQILLDWDKKTSQWINNQKADLFYTGCGFFDYAILYQWDSAWVKSEKFINRLDCYGNISVYGFEKWDHENQHWKKREMNYLYYTYLFTGIITHADMDINIYPNPAHGFFHFDCPDNESVKSMELYSINGQMIKTIPAAGSSGMIPVAGLPSGFYIVSFTLKDNHTINKRIIIY